MLRQLHWKTLIVILAIVGLAGATLAFQQFRLPGIGERGSEDILGLHLGLDLAGGAHLVYQACVEDVPAGEECPEDALPDEDQMQGVIDTISRRINRLGVTEPSIQQLGDNRIVIQLPGVEDVERAQELIGQTAQLQVVERVCTQAPSPGEEEYCNEPSEYEDQPTGLTGADIESASVGQSPTGEYVVRFELAGGDASQTFARLTQRLYATLQNTQHPDQLAFVLDDEVLVSAVVQNPILTGSGQITGRFTAEEARNIVIQIEAGALPVNVNPLSNTVIAPTLGQESLENALTAGGIGLLLVMFFMLAYYRMSGLVAALALVFYTAVVLAVFKLVPVTLTLAGLAALVLSIGMAVDANVLIFERIKEELRLGRTLQFATQIGFNRAWPSIRDGNVSTLIIAGILFFFGSQTANATITGFAVALSIGIVISMFTAIVVSRQLYRVLLVTPLRRIPGMFTPEAAAAVQRRSPAATERGS